MSFPWGLVAAFGALVALEKWRGRPEEERNPQFRTTPSGVVYPLRGTDGPGGQYDETKTADGKTKTTVEEMIRSDTYGYRRLDDLETRLDFTERRLAEGKPRKVGGNLRGGDREASISQMRAYVKRVKPLVERRHRLREELREVRQAQQDLYNGRLTEEQRRAAGQKYKELKRRQEQIEKDLERLE